jgi:hypothetical protein
MSMRAIFMIPIGESFRMKLTSMREADAENLIPS